MVLGCDFACGVGLGENGLCLVIWRVCLICMMDTAKCIMGC